MEHSMLAQIEAIKQLKARYFRAMDLGDWASYEATFADDGVLIVESLTRKGNNGAALTREATGRGAIVKWISAVLDGATTIHHGHMPEIEILSDDRARGIWAMEDRVIWPSRQLHGWGHYHDDYKLIDGAWRIARSRLTRLHVVTSGEPTAPTASVRMLDA